jgi:hypothetical protein
MNHTIELDAYVRLLPRLVLMVALVEYDGRYDTVLEDGLVTTASDITALSHSVVATAEEAGYVVKNLTLYVVPDATLNRLIATRCPPQAEERPHER